MNGDTQWTPDALRDYEDSVATLLESLTAHRALVIAREGRARELEPYFTSIVNLRLALRHAAAAEFNWCGSAPFPFIEEVPPVDDAEPSEEPGGRTLSVFLREDYDIEDEPAVVDAGRRAYRAAWPGDTDEDAEHRVTDARSAAMEIIDASGCDELHRVTGLRLSMDFTTAVQHDGDEREGAPFALVNRR